MNSQKEWIKAFLMGSVTTLLAIRVISHFSIQKKKTDQDHSTKVGGSSKQSVVMDSPDLDQRILRKAETALQNRTSRLIVVIERCTNDHNYSAILRTTEALGIHHVYIISPQSIKSTLKLGADGLNLNSMGGDYDAMPIEKATLFRSTGQKVKNSTQEEIQDRASHHLFAKKALEWLNVREFDTTKECIDVLRKDGFKIWSTDLSQVAVTLTPEGLSEGNLSNEPLIPEKLAIVFGTEAVGCSTEILDASDKRVYLPLRGFADSLNLSVATALVVHHLFILDPSLIGAMSEEERIEIRRKWYAKLASQRLLPKAEKSKRKRLNNQVRTISEYEKRMCNPDHKLTPEQLEKVKLLPQFKKELEDIERDLQEKSLRAVEELVRNPPQPLGDMRRADEHRITFAGKNIKKTHGEAWENMPATTYYTSKENASSSFFRSQLDNQD